MIWIHVFFISREYFILSREFLPPLKYVSITFIFDSGESGKLLKGWEAYIKVSKSLYLPPSHRWGSSVMRVGGGEETHWRQEWRQRILTAATNSEEGGKNSQNTSILLRVFFSQTSTIWKWTCEAVGKTCWWMSSDEILLLQKVDPKSFRKSQNGYYRGGMRGSSSYRGLIKVNINLPKKKQLISPPIFWKDKTFRWRRKRV